MQQPPPSIPFVEYVLKAIEHPPHMFVTKLAACCTMLFLTRSDPATLRLLCHKWAIRFSMDRKALIDRAMERMHASRGMPTFCRTASTDDVNEIPVGFEISDADACVQHFLSIVNSIVPMYFSYNWDRTEQVIRVNREYEVYVRRELLPMCIETPAGLGLDEDEQKPWLLPPSTYTSSSSIVNYFMSPVTRREPLEFAGSPSGVNPKGDAIFISTVGSSGSQTCGESLGLTFVTLGNFREALKHSVKGLVLIFYARFSMKSVEVLGLFQDMIAKHSLDPMPNIGVVHSVTEPELAHLYNVEWLPTIVYIPPPSERSVDLECVMREKELERLEGAASRSTRRSISCPLSQFTSPVLPNSVVIGKQATGTDTPHLSNGNGSIASDRGAGSGAMLTPRELLGFPKVLSYHNRSISGERSLRRDRSSQVLSPAVMGSSAAFGVSAPVLPAATSTTTTPTTQLPIESPQSDTIIRSSPMISPAQTDRHAKVVTTPKKTTFVDLAVPEGARPRQLQKLSPLSSPDTCGTAMKANEEKSDNDSGVTESTHSNGTNPSTGCPYSVTSPDALSRKTVEEHRDVLRGECPGSTQERTASVHSSRGSCSGDETKLDSYKNLLDREQRQETLVYVCSQCGKDARDKVEDTDSAAYGVSAGKKAHETEDVAYSQDKEQPETPENRIVPSLSNGTLDSALMDDGNGTGSNSGAHKKNGHLSRALTKYSACADGMNVAQLSERSTPLDRHMAISATQPINLSLSSVPLHAHMATPTDTDNFEFVSDSDSLELSWVPQHDGHKVYPSCGIMTTVALCEWINSKGETVRKPAKEKPCVTKLRMLKDEERYRKARQQHSAMVMLRRLQNVNPCTSERCHDERPMFIFLGGGMAAGKTTAATALARSDWWEHHKEHAVLVNADEFKLTVPVPTALEPIMHERSTRDAEFLLVQAMNQGRCVVLDGTMMWAPFVKQVVEMVRRAHTTLFRQGRGYNKDEKVEEYFVEEGPRPTPLPAPYQIRLLAITVEPEIAIPRGFLRQFSTGRAVPISSQLRSFKQFAENFSTYASWMDGTTLYDNNVFVDLENGELPPVMAEQSPLTGNEFKIYDEYAYQLFMRQRYLNDEAGNVQELYAPISSPTSGIFKLNSGSNSSSIISAVNGSPSPMRRRLTNVRSQDL